MQFPCACGCLGIRSSKERIEDARVLVEQAAQRGRSAMPGFLALRGEEVSGLTDAQLTNGLNRVIVSNRKL